METRAFLRVHFPCVEHTEIEANEFFDLWNELVFGFRKSYSFSHHVDSVYYQLLQDGLFMLIEQEKYVVWDNNTPYEFGYIQREGDEILEDDLQPDIEIV